MVFSSPLFLFGFFPVFLLVFALSPRRLANAIIFAASILFYAWGEPVFAWIALVSALADLGVVHLMAKAATASRRKWLAALGIVANLALLIFFKYSNFFYANVQAAALGWASTRLPDMGAIALPIGVSFIVFEKITYVVDVYRGVGRPARSVLQYLTYVFLFPKLLAGPIVKYHDIEAQLAERPARFDDLVEGLTRFAIGLAKKVLIADAMGEIADRAFAAGPTVGFGFAWFGALAFSFQIYFDFSGYSDMAIGIARILGFRLMENFNRPYLAVGFGDFWRRWHISLSTWVRDYLYLPLGGDRVAAPRLTINLWTCFLASGLWHGASWTFVVWGAYHGLFLTLDRLFLRRVLRAAPQVVAVGLTFAAITVGWVLFRAESIAGAGAYLAAMFDPGAEYLGRPTMTTLDLEVAFAIAASICFVPLVPGFGGLQRMLAERAWWPTAKTGLACVLLLAALAKATTVAFHPFLYFRF